MRPEWLLTSRTEGKICLEDRFGFMSKGSPFGGKQVCMTSTFVEENSEKPYKLQNCRLLVETLGKGSLCEDPDKADFILASDRELTKHIDREDWAGVDMV